MQDGVGPSGSRTGTGSRLLEEWGVASAPDPYILTPALGSGFKSVLRAGQECVDRLSEGGGWTLEPPITGAC